MRTVKATDGHEILIFPSVRTPPTIVTQQDGPEPGYPVPDTNNISPASTLYQAGTVKTTSTDSFPIRIEVPRLGTMIRPFKLGGLSAILSNGIEVATDQLTQTSKFTIKLSDAAGNIDSYGINTIYKRWNDIPFAGTVTASSYTITTVDTGIDNAFRCFILGYDSSIPAFRIYSYKYDQAVDTTWILEGTSDDLPLDQTFNSNADIASCIFDNTIYIFLTGDGGLFSVHRYNPKTGAFLRVSDPLLALDSSQQATIDGGLSATATRKTAVVAMGMALGWGAGPARTVGITRSQNMTEWNKRAGQTHTAFVLGAFNDGLLTTEGGRGVSVTKIRMVYRSLNKSPTGTGPLYGWATTREGAIFYTEDGGTTWTKESNPMEGLVSLWDIGIPADTQPTTPFAAIYAVGSHGTVLKREDDGTGPLWKVVDTNLVGQVGDLSLWVEGVDRNNAGKSLSRLGDAFLLTAGFSDSTHGWVGGKNGALYSTYRGGSEKDSQGSWLPSGDGWYAITNNRIDARSPAAPYIVSEDFVYKLAKLDGSDVTSIEPIIDDSTTNYGMLLVTFSTTAFRIDPSDLTTINQTLAGASETAEQTRSATRTSRVITFWNTYRREQGANSVVSSIPFGADQIGVMGFDINATAFAGVTVSGPDTNRFIYLIGPDGILFKYGNNGKNVTSDKPGQLTALGTNMGRVSFKSLSIYRHNVVDGNGNDLYFASNVGFDQYMLISSPANLSSGTINFHGESIGQAKVVRTVSMNGITEAIAGGDSGIWKNISAGAEVANRAYPVLLKSNSGRMLLAVTNISMGYVEIWKSNDGGGSWSLLSNVQSGAFSFTPIDSDFELLNLESQSSVPKATLVEMDDGVIEMTVDTTTVASMDGGASWLDYDDNRLPLRGSLEQFTSADNTDGFTTLIAQHHTHLGSYGHGPAYMFVVASGKVGVWRSRDWALEDADTIAMPVIPGKQQWIGVDDAIVTFSSPPAVADGWTINTKYIFSGDNISVESPSIYWRAADNVDSEIIWDRRDPAISAITGGGYLWRISAIALFGTNIPEMFVDITVPQFVDSNRPVQSFPTDSSMFTRYRLSSVVMDTFVIDKPSDSIFVVPQQMVPGEFASGRREYFLEWTPWNTPNDLSGGKRVYRIIDNTENSFIIDRDQSDPAIVGTSALDRVRIFTDRMWTDCSDGRRGTDMHTPAVVGTEYEYGRLVRVYSPLLTTSSRYTTSGFVKIGTAVMGQLIGAESGFGKRVGFSGGYTFSEKQNAFSATGISGVSVYDHIGKVVGAWEVSYRSVEEWDRNTTLEPMAKRIHEGFAMVFDSNSPIDSLEYVRMLRPISVKHVAGRYWDYGLSLQEIK